MATESPYPREDWWGSIDDDQSAASSDIAHGTDRFEVIAYRLLKDSAPALVSVVGLEEEGAELLCGEPVAYVPPTHGTDDYDEHRPYRVDEAGYVTDPLVPDRPAPEFLAVVEIVLAHAQTARGVSQRQAVDIRSLARYLKHRQHEGVGSDRDILAKVLRACDDRGELDRFENMYDGWERGTK